MLFARLVAAVLLAALLTPAARAADLPDHRVGMGLGGVSYYQSYAPFRDLVKTMRFRDVGSWADGGLPASAADGKTVTGRVGVDNAEPFPTGDYVLTWRGEGEVALDRPNDAELVSDESDGDAHRRVYRLPDGPGKYGLQVEIKAFPVADLHLYVPGTEEAEGRWNPEYLRVMEPFRGTHLRFMDLNHTNHSKQQDWSDRMPPDAGTYLTNHVNSPEIADRGAVPYEAMIELCNALDADMWLTVPHLATAEYRANLAHLIRTGVDKATGERTAEPLDEDLKIWLEYSNEVWNWNFAQSKWVNENVEGDKLDDKYSKKAKELFDAFEAEFGGSDRLVRVIGTQTGYSNGWRSQQRLAALDAQGGTADALAITTYFAHDIEQWIVDNWPVTKEQTFKEFASRVGTGPFTLDESEHQRNHNKVHHYRIAEEYGIPVVAYEGGPHLLPERPVVPPDATVEEGDKPKKQRATKLVPEMKAFIQDLERDPRFGEIYKQHLARHEASGLRVNTPFVLVAGWRDSGQWGHMESLAPGADEAVKYRAILDFYDLPAPPPAESE